MLRVMIVEGIAEEEESRGCYSRPPKEERVTTIGESEKPGKEKEEKANS